MGPSATAPPRSPKSETLLKPVLCAFFLGAPLLRGQALASSAPPDPISMSASARAGWVLSSTVGFVPISTLTIESGLETWSNSPKEFDTHWTGFGERVGSKLATSAVSNTMEASLGSLWGEDPRYRRLGKGSFSMRIKHSLAMSVSAENASGGTMPAYSRYIAIPSSRFISNTWLPASQQTLGSTFSRVGFAFLRRAAGNTFQEFWPDLRRHLHKAPPD